MRDVQGPGGGRNVTVRADGTVEVQVVTPAATGLHEKRYVFELTEEKLRALLARHLLDYTPTINNTSRTP